MRLLIAISAAAIVSVFGLTAGQAENDPAPLSGDQILARAGAAEGLHSFSVPVHLDVRLHKPLGLKVGMSGTAYFKAPAKSAFVITKAPPIIGGFFKGQYNLDLLPQAWPAKYKVDGVYSVTRNGVPAYELHATPRGQIGANRVVFDVVKSNFMPLTAQWFYPDGSTIGLSLGNQRVENYVLPESESVNVAMPKYNLDATSSFGQYALNVPVPDSVFATK
jgi:hypothetical protein